MDAAGLFAELKRRRVTRALLGYGLVAFAVLQVIEPIMHGLRWPDAVLSYVVVALGVGFPIVVILAWVFDVNAGGIERTPGPSPTGLKGSALAVVLLAIGALAAAPGLGWYLLIRGRSRPAVDASASIAAPVPAIPSIAVLPFADMSPQRDQEYFSDGIAEEIIHALMQVKGLRVIGRTSSFAFKGKSEDLRTIAHKLDAGHVLEGSVRKDGDAVRIMARLSASGGEQVWSHAFDRELKSVFAVQDEIAKAVVGALRVDLLSGRSTTRPETAPLAYKKFLQATELSRTGAGWKRRVDAYREAVAADPNYAPGWARLSETWWLAAGGAVTPKDLDEANREMTIAAEKAIALEPSLPDGYLARALARLAGWNWKGAKDDLDRALVLGPASAEAQRTYGLLLQTVGKLDESEACLRKATRLDPYDRTSWEFLGETLMWAGRYAAARDAFGRAQIALNTLGGYDANLDWWVGVAWLLDGNLALAEEWQSKERSARHVLSRRAQFAHLRGEQREAREALAAFTELTGAGQPYWVALHHAFFGNNDLAFEWLSRALSVRHPDLRWIKVDPFLKGLRGDPRYRAILVKMNLPLD